MVLHKQEKRTFSFPFFTFPVLGRSIGTVLNTFKKQFSAREICFNHKKDNLKRYKKLCVENLKPVRILICCSCSL